MESPSYQRPTPPLPQGEGEGDRTSPFSDLGAYEKKLSALESESFTLKMRLYESQTKLHEANHKLVELQPSIGENTGVAWLEPHGTNDDVVQPSPPVGMVDSAVEEVWRWSPRLEKQQEQEKAHEWEHMRLEAEALKRRNADLESEVTALRASTILASTTGQDACIATIASVAEMAALMRGPGPGAGETAARTQHATNQNPLALRKELHENMKVERETNSALATHDTHVIESLEQSLAGSGSELEYWKDACRKLQDTHSGKQHAGALGEGYGMRLLSQASLSSVDDWTAEEENAAVDAETLATHTTAGGRTTRSPSPSKRQSSPGSTARSNSSSPYTLPQTKTYKASSKVYVDASKNRAISPSRRAQGARELAAAAVREIASLRRRLDRAMASRAKWKAHALESAQTASAAAAAAMVAVATPELFMTPTTPPRGASTDDPLSPSPLSSPTSVLAEEAEDQHARELELMTALEAIIDKCSALEARHGNK